MVFLRQYKSWTYQYTYQLLSIYISAFKQSLWYFWKLLPKASSSESFLSRYTCQREDDGPKHWLGTFSNNFKKSITENRSNCLHSRLRRSHREGQAKHIFFFQNGYAKKLALTRPYDWWRFVFELVFRWQTQSGVFSFSSTCKHEFWSISTFAGTCATYAYMTCIYIYRQINVRYIQNTRLNNDSGAGRFLLGGSLFSRGGTSPPHSLTENRRSGCVGGRESLLRFSVDVLLICFLLRNDTFWNSGLSRNSSINKLVCLEVNKPVVCVQVIHKDQKQYGIEFFVRRRRRASFFLEKSRRMGDFFEKKVFA